MYSRLLCLAAFVASSVAASTPYFILPSGVGIALFEEVGFGFTVEDPTTGNKTDCQVNWTTYDEAPSGWVRISQV